MLHLAVVLGRLEIKRLPRLQPLARPWLAIAALALPPAAAGASKPEQAPTCVRSWPEVRYQAYGYNHIVHLANDCRMEALCKVWTDVNPHVSSVHVPGRHQIEVLTMRGSPARQFTPHVSCTMALPDATK